MSVILGIETSCDETSAAVVVDGVDVRSNVVASQVDLHAKYGGVVPEIAARAHIERLDAVIEEALTAAGIDAERLRSAARSHLPLPAPSPLPLSLEGRGVSNPSSLLSNPSPLGGEGRVRGFSSTVEVDGIDAIAVTHRPGLVGALLIGVTAAKTLSWAWKKPLIGVDHIRAHAYSAAIGLDKPPWPAVGLIVSGGHTSLFLIREATQIDLLGATMDDAAGEAFDKVATVLGLGYPGGPLVENLARDGDPRAVEFPRTMLGADSLDFSFSGVKTAVLYHVNGPGKTSGGLEKLSAMQLADIAASFQQAVIDVLVRKTLLAVIRTGTRTVVLGGGVAANKALRAALEVACTERGLTFHAAKWAYCTDNAAMIAGLGYHQLLRGDVATLELDAIPHAS